MEATMSRPAKLGNPRKWQPTKWEPIYEAIVAESILGKTNKYLAERYDYTEQQISNILNTNKAKELKQDAIEAIKKNSIALMEGEFSQTMARAVSNVHKVITNEELLENHPFSMFEKSLQVLKGLGKLQGDGPVTNNTVNVPNGQAVINLGEEATKTFLDGLEKANKAIEMHKDVTGESIK